MGGASVREELIATLEEILGLQRRLVAAARDPRVPAPELVAQMSVLERLDDRRDELTAELRRQASRGLREARPGRSVRQVVLEALSEFRWPQNAGFCEEYLWATRQLQIDSRAFAPLRRDERRAWDRSRAARRAFVAPALREDGTANPRWLTSSAWDLERRIVSCERTEQLLDLQKILILSGRPGADGEPSRARRPTDVLLERYAVQLLGMEWPPLPADARQAQAWRRAARRLASERIGQIRAHDDPARKQIAAVLAGLPERDLVWGREPAPARNGAGQ